MWLRDNETSLGRFSRAFIPRQSRLHTLEDTDKRQQCPCWVIFGKGKTADFTSSMLYAPALRPESRKHFQSFLLCLAVTPLPLLEERGRSHSGNLGLRLKRLQIHLSIRLYQSRPWYQSTTTVSIYVRLSSWSSLYKIKRSIDRTRREIFCLKNVTMERMPLAQNLCYNTLKGWCTKLLSGLQVPKYSRWSLRQTNKVGGNN